MSDGATMLLAALFFERNERWEARRRSGTELRWPLWVLRASVSVFWRESSGMGGGAGMVARARARLGSVVSEASCTPASLLNVSMV